jgi:hypothetical protein
VNSGGIYTTPIKTSSSNLNNVDDTFTQNTNLLSFFIIVINLSNFSLYPKAIPKNSKRPRKNIKSRWTLLLENIDKK